MAKRYFKRQYFELIIIDQNSKTFLESIDVISFDSEDKMADDIVSSINTRFSKNKYIEVNSDYFDKHREFAFDYQANKILKTKFGKMPILTFRKLEVCYEK